MSTNSISLIRQWMEQETPCKIAYMSQNYKGDKLTEIFEGTICGINKRFYSDHNGNFQTLKLNFIDLTTGKMKDFDLKGIKPIQNIGIISLKKLCINMIREKKDLWTEYDAIMENFYEKKKIKTYSNNIGSGVEMYSSFETNDEITQLAKLVLRGFNTNSIDQELRTYVICRAIELCVEQGNINSDLEIFYKLSSSPRYYNFWFLLVHINLFYNEILPFNAFQIYRLVKETQYTFEDNKMFSGSEAQVFTQMRDELSKKVVEKPSVLDYYTQLADEMEQTSNWQIVPFQDDVKVLCKLGEKAIVNQDLEKIQQFIEQAALKIGGGSYEPDKNFPLLLLKLKAWDQGFTQLTDEDIFHIDSVERNFDYFEHMIYNLISAEEEIEEFKTLREKLRLTTECPEAIERYYLRPILF